MQSITLATSANPTTTTFDGSPVRCVSASEVDHLICHLEKNPSKIFKIESKKMTCLVKAPLPTVFGAPTSASVNITVQMQQFPLIPNYATTGHKLQGQSKDSLVISVWSNRRNWNYVALSRVRTRSGLYLVKPLPHNADFSVPQELNHMMSILRQKAPADDIDLDLDDDRNYRRARGN